MAEDEGALDTLTPASNGSDTMPQVGVVAQYVKDLSFENPNAPAVFQWQSQPQTDVQVNIGTMLAGAGPARGHAEDRHHRDRARGHRLSRRAALCRPVRAHQHPGRSAPALPARRGAAHPLPVRPQDHRRRDASRAASRRCGSTRSISPASICSRRTQAAAAGRGTDSGAASALTGGRLFFLERRPTR